MTTINTVGRHSAIVQASEFGESGTGTPYLRIDFAGDGEASEGSISAWLYLSEKALPNTVRTLRDAFGFDGDFETVSEQIADKPCSLTCESERYEDKDRVKVKWINAPRTSRPIADQSSFLKTLSAKAARIPKEAPKAPAPTRTPPPARVVKKDVPFA